MSGPAFIIPQQVHALGGGTPPSDVYANQLRLGATIFDVTLTFGATEDIGTGQIFNRDRAVVRMSFSMAKNLLLHLQTAIESYEHTVSEIRVPERMPNELAAMKERIEALFREQMIGTAPLNVERPE